MTKVFVEQPLASPGTAKHFNACAMYFFHFHLFTFPSNNKEKSK